jgi:hypothetical protein
MKRAKRIVITAIKQYEREGMTHREFFSVPVKHSEESQRAIRFCFARKHNIEQDQVTIEQAPDRVKYKTPSVNRKVGTSEEYNASRAIAYATWLAQRDGIELPKGYRIKARVDWSGVYEGNTYRRRVQGVEWGTEYKEEKYNTRKNGRRGAYTHTVTNFDVALRIEIPNWNWMPTETEQVWTAARKRIEDYDRREAAGENVSDELRPRMPGGSDF